MELGSILIIGGGHMGHAICEGLLDRCAVPASLICVAEPHEEGRAFFSDKLGVRTVADARDALPVDTIILAVRPNVVLGVCESLAETGLDAATLVISIAAGVSTASLAKALGRSEKPEDRLVRVMPNAPLAYGAGIAGISGAAHCPDDALQAAIGLFEALGGAVPVPEDQLDIVTAVSGSGPAYFELAIAALAQGAVELGMTYENAVALALQTMYGTAVMLKETGQDPAEALSFICTEGGTTEAALNAMRESGIEAAFAAGVHAAAVRSQELGR